MRTLAGVVAALATTLLLTIAQPAAAADAGVEAEFVAALNEVRSEAGLHPLATDGELVDVARRWSDVMAGEGRIWHNPNLADDVTAPWVLIGENVGVGYDVPTLVQAFVDSPAHYRNIVDPRFDWIGVGVTWGPDGRLFTTHVFMDLGDPAEPSAPQPAAPPVAASAAAASAPTPASPAPPAPPPAAAAHERVEAVLAAVRTLGADGVA